MKATRMLDARDACCMDTLSRPIEEAMTGIASDEAVDVLIRPSFERMLRRFAQEKGLAVLEEERRENELRFTIAGAPGERKKENCMVCGGPLEYLTEAVSVTCLYCGKQETGYVRCVNGHYICDLCHGKGAYEAVSDMVLSTKERDPLAIATSIMGHPAIPMLGCENALAVAGALMAALKNGGYEGIEDKHIIEAMERTQRQAIAPYCALTGVCGVPIAVGAVVSVLLGAECPKDRETAITMHATARVIDAIANDTGPCCCKSYVWTGIGVAYNLCKEYLNLRLPIHREKVVCSHFKRHPHGCQGARCSYIPKRAQRP